MNIKISKFLHNKKLNMNYILSSNALEDFYYKININF